MTIRRRGRLPALCALIGASLCLCASALAAGDAKSCDERRDRQKQRHPGCAHRAGVGKGSFELVGPVVAPGHVSSNGASGEPQTGGPVGASADLSHVLLSVWASGKQAWPGDSTVEGGDSLYEYAGTGDREPVLVGVNNEGRLHGSPYVNEGAELISKCGTVLGSLGAASHPSLSEARHKSIPCRLRSRSGPLRGMIQRRCPGIR
jgi:hypothetical protein